MIFMKNIMIFMKNIMIFMKNIVIFSSVLLLFCCCDAALAPPAEEDHCMVDLIDEEVPVLVMTQMPQTYLNIASLPKKFDWRNVNGRSFITATKNQHVPVYCGSCWAFATLSALADRIKIMRRAVWPDIEMSAQVLLNCAGAAGNCRGGHPAKVYQFLQTAGVPEETCSPYLAKDGMCDALSICKDCNRTGDCWPLPNPRKYFVEEYGRVNGEDNMMAEIYGRGPIACGIAITPDLYAYTSGIFQDNTGITHIGHLVSVIGWGEEGGVKYWTVRNSWGSAWGEAGFFRIVRGSNNMGMEADCFWAVPKQTWPSAAELHVDTDTIIAPST
eukprot:gnl/Hemi2/2434_TR862_c0_g1_i1.p1 gnl/Hemi2/2434_TR862_c0_g1~~gnl/Hemi2/2434_TR862_c0_g1_i1.p1  ORF type:complete len:329 (-),score=74.08 gnl/Hemi2/2434_TR862_c0_g1_i1:64-1050(-)